MFPSPAVVFKASVITSISDVTNPILIKFQLGMVEIQSVSGQIWRLFSFGTFGSLGSFLIFQEKTQDVFSPPTKAKPNAVITY